MSDEETASAANPASNWTAAMVVAAVLLTGAVFVSRFDVTIVIAARLAGPLAAALLTGLASMACGVAALSFAARATSRAGGFGDATPSRPDPVLELLVGATIFGSLLALTAALHVLVPVTVIALTMLAAAAGGLLRWRALVTLFASIRIGPVALIFPPVLLAFVTATTPVNTPDELVYKLSLPHEYLMAGGMIEMPLKSHSYIPASLSMADSAALVMSGGVAARLFHFLLYLCTLSLLQRMASRLLPRGSMWPVIALAWTPALALIAGWAWTDWTMIGLLIASMLRWQEFLDSRDGADLGDAAASLGAALSAQYSALPWVVVFLPLALWRAARMGGVIRRLAAAGLVVALFGGFFYARNLFWTGSPLAPFFLPDSPGIANYRSDASGWRELALGFDIFHPGIIDDSLGILLPALVLLAPLALLARTPLALDLFLLGGAQLVLLIPLAPTSRLLTPALVPLVLLGAFVAARSWLQAGRAMRSLLAVLAGAALSAQLLLMAWVYVTSWQFLPYLVGAESEDAYLTRTRDFQRPYKWIEDNTAADAKLLLLGENRTFHLKRRSLAQGNLDGPRMNAWLSKAADAAGLGAALRAEGVTHVLIHKPWYRAANPAIPPLRMLEKEYVLEVSPRTDAMVRGLLASQAKPVYSDRAYVLFELRRN